MKKLLNALLLLCTLACINAWGETVNFGSSGPTGCCSEYGDPYAPGFTLYGLASYASNPALILDARPSVSYDRGSFDFFGARFSFTPYEMGGSGSLFYNNTPYTMTMVFKDISGAVLDTEYVYMTPSTSIITKFVANVHEIDFSADSDRRTPRLMSMDLLLPPVPEPSTYAMFVVGLAVLLQRRRRALGKAAVLHRMAAQRRT